MVRKLALLGSTGSIGRQTLDVVEAMGDRVEVYGLTAHRNVRLLAEQSERFRPSIVVVGEEADASSLAETHVLRGDEGMVELVSDPQVDLVVVGTVGAAGLLPTIAAIRAGKLVALANKETLVMAGGIIREELSRAGGELVPIDSEHSAIWQCLQGEPHREIERLTLTASGGALRRLTQDQLSTVTPEQALHHPTWSMGRKITVDSATLMNKGLEVIEARWLFDVSIDRVEVLMHDESIVHSLVTFTDSSTKAQVGLPDMRLPIQYALSHPDRWPNQLPRLDLATQRLLHFGPVDWNRYPALRLAIQAGRQGGTYPAVLAAADEIAVESFLQGAISFTDIPAIIETVLGMHEPCSSPILDDILSADLWARSTTAKIATSV